MLQKIESKQGQAEELKKKQMDEVKEKVCTTCSLYYSDYKSH